MSKRPYQDNPPRFDYVLTEKGRDLFAVITALRQWGDEYAAPKGAPIEVEHLARGAASQLGLTCDHCQRPVGPRDVRARPGPGGGRLPKPAARA